MFGLLDKFFLLLFARYRRQTGSAHTEAAWRRACSDVWWSSALVIGGIVFIGIWIWYALTRMGTPHDHREWAVYGGIGAYFIFMTLLKRRFRKFLVDVPQIPTIESASDARYIRMSRFVLNAIAVAIGVAVWILQSQHLAALKGF